MEKNGNFAVEFDFLKPFFRSKLCGIFFESVKFAVGKWNSSEKFSSRSCKAENIPVVARGLVH